MLYGIDISHWQRNIKLAEANIDFAICKATEGRTFKDDCFNKFMATLKRNNKLRGAYHFMSASSNIYEQADNFIEAVLPYLGDCILVLDYEGNASRKFTVDDVKEWLDYVYAHTGVKPLVYMNKSDLRNKNWKKVVDANYGLWIADYIKGNKCEGHQEKLNKTISGDWDFVAIRQYTSGGILPCFKGELDLDVAYMTEEAWLKYAMMN